MSDTIHIELIGNTWHAKHSGPQSKDIVSLFGTDTIPTPFTNLTARESVVVEIQKLNPTVEVL